MVIINLFIFIRSVARYFQVKKVWVWLRGFGILLCVRNFLGFVTSLMVKSVWVWLRLLGILLCGRNFLGFVTSLIKVDFNLEWHRGFYLINGCQFHWNITGIPNVGYFFHHLAFAWNYNYPLGIDFLTWNWLLVFVWFLSRLNNAICRALPFCLLWCWLKRLCAGYFL